MSCHGVLLMARLAFLLPYNTAHRKLADQSGSKCSRHLPAESWFESMLQQHGLQHLRLRRNQSVTRTDLNEQQTGLIVKLVPGSYIRRASDKLGQRE